MLNVISGRDLRDWMQSAMPPPTISSTKFEWRGARVGCWSDPCAGQVEDEVGVIVRAAVDDLAQAGEVGVDRLGTAFVTERLM